MVWEEFLERLKVRFSEWPTPEIYLFEVGVIVAAFLTYRFLSARVERVRGHLALIAIGMFLIEFFTGPMWNNQRLGFWAYVYSDVSWILTVGWTVLISLSIYFVENVLRITGAARRYLGFLLVITPVTLVFESLVRAIGIRTYSPETIAAAGPGMIPVLDVPLAGLYYVPVMMTLVWSFYKHWLPSIEPSGQVPGRLPLLNRLALTTIAVFLFEIVIEPMVANEGFPRWSYVWHDITIIMTGLWVVMLTVVTLGIDRIFRTTDFRIRFAMYLVAIAAIATPIEGWFISAGYRVYGPSAVADFIGLRTWIGDIPVEVMAAIPIYLALVIATVRYWDGSIDRSLGFRVRTPQGQGSARSQVAPAMPGGA